MSNIKGMYYELLSLSVYRDYIETEVGDSLLVLLESLIEKDDQSTMISNYANFVKNVYKTGGNLSKQVQEFIKTSEDAYLQLILAGATIPVELVKAQESDLAVLQKVANLTSSELIDAIGAQMHLPSYATSNINIISYYKDMIANVETMGYGIFAESPMFKVKNNMLVPVINPEFQRLDQFYGYKLEREQVLKNTEALAKGKNASNVLLYGDAGTGKSSTVKACAGAFFEQGVRLVEFQKSQVGAIPEIAEKLRNSPLKFIFYIDDLSFSENDDNFYALKGVLEGNISGCANNIVIYATSNRRHLVRESMEARQGNDLHLNDTLQETMSLSARFGLTITFSKPAKDLYVEIVLQLADEYGLEYEEADLIKRAEAFAIRANGRSPRTAKQFIILATNNMR